MKVNRLSEFGKFMAYTAIGATLTVAGVTALRVYEGYNTKAYNIDVNNDGRIDTVIKTPFNTDIYLQQPDGSLEKLYDIKKSEEKNNQEKVDNKYNSLEDKVKDLD